MTVCRAYAIIASMPERFDRNQLIKFRQGLNPLWKNRTKILKVLCLCFVLLGLPIFVQAENLLHHALAVKVSPASSELRVVDRMTLPETLHPDEQGRYYFRLHAGLVPQAMTAGVLIELIPEIPMAEAPVRSEGSDEEMPLAVRKIAPSAHYAMTLPIGLKTVVLSYQGVIHHPLSEHDSTSGQEADTPGMISPEGVFLSGKSLWYPQFDQALMTFSLDVTLPESWHAVSQGERTRHVLQEGRRVLHWDSPEPQREIFLVGGAWTEYRRSAGRVETYVYLRRPDKAVANRYLKATEQYLEMYQKLLGPYPYKKFALLENFWETTYGMPSFTLLGSKALHRPLTLNTIYPHEILRNWWGNGVYVDEAQGDWSGGLRTYLSDYLLAEQAGKGQESRLSALQKYANTVQAGQDFPLALFQSRFDSESQAIASSKTLFLFHMFRQMLGDRVFVEALRTFFHENRFSMASFSDLSQAFSRAARRDLRPEFMQWVERAGAPRLRAKNVRSDKAEEGYLLSATFQQRQAGPAYHLQIPVSVTLHGKKEAFQTTIEMRKKTLEVALVLPARPIRLKIDPEYDLFRRLHPAEMPPTLAKAFAAKLTLILLPATAALPERRAYEALAKDMQEAQPEQIEIGWDNDYKALPKDRSIWLFGWENRFQRTILTQLRGFGVSANSAMTRIGDIQIPRRGFSLVLTGRHPKTAKHTLSWLASDRAVAIPRLGEKLSRYASYGYLGFAGDAVKNIEKGRWPAVGSPMSIRIKQGDGRWIKEKPTTLAAREALTNTSPLFSEERMRRDIAYLSDVPLKGRGFGTVELDRAAEYIASEFRRAGLNPAEGQGRSFLQQWREESGGVDSGVTLKNVVSILPGSAASLSHELIVIGAHYDHLGFGWPRVHQGDEGKLHPGANSNASGIALLLELARLLKEEQPLRRSILFVAFTAKEVGLLGSAHLASQQQGAFRGRMRAMINLDTVGALRDNRLFVLGTGSSREWPPMLRRIGADLGIEVAAFPNAFGTSDQMSFINAGIPAIQIFTGMTADVDRPSDTLEKIDLPGMVAVGRVVKELIQDLANRPTPLSLVPLQKERPNLIWERRDR